MECMGDTTMQWETMKRWPSLDTDRRIFRYSFSYRPRAFGGERFSVWSGQILSYCTLQVQLTRLLASRSCALRRTKHCGLAQASVHLHSQCGARLLHRDNVCSSL